MNIKAVIANGVLFQVGWFLCVVFGDLAALTAAMVMIAIYALYYARSSQEYLFFAVIMAIGFAGDTLLSLTGILVYPSGLPFPPIWMMVLWMLFAMTLPWSLHWLVSRPRLFTVFCAIGGTFSYFVGVRLSGVQFGQDLLVCLGALLVLWAVHGYLLGNLYAQWRQRWDAI